MFAAALWGLLSWQWNPALPVGIFFELLWLDLFPAGTFIPPHALLAVSASMTLLAGLDWPPMRVTVLCLMAALPLAYLGSLAEGRYRKRQNLSYNALLLWNRKSGKGNFSPDRLVIRALVEQFALSFLFFCVLILPLRWLIGFFAARVSVGVQPSWAVLWIIAGLGAILSLRIRKAHIVALVCLGAALLV